MYQIQKYTLPILSDCEVEMPAGTTPFLAEAQNGHVCLWVMASKDAVMVKKKFALFKTGNDVSLSPGKLKYIGTAKLYLQDQELGVHVFEVL